MLSANIGNKFITHNFSLDLSCIIQKLSPKSNPKSEQEAISVISRNLKNYFMLYLHVIMLSFVL